MDDRILLGTIWVAKPYDAVGEGRLRGKRRIDRNGGKDGFYGLAGDDTIYGLGGTTTSLAKMATTSFPAAMATIFSWDENGNDMIDAGTGANTIDGGAGSDTLIIERAGIFMIG